MRAHQGHGHAADSFAFKAGDGLYGTFECRTVDQLIVFGSNGRVYSVAVAQLPGGRGDGQPITTLIDLEAGTQPVHYFAGPAQALLVLAGSGGYGFVASVEHMTGRNRGGKAFVSLAEGESLCRPSHASGSSASQPLAAATQLCCISVGGRVLTFDLAELKTMEKGGRGLLLLDLEEGDRLAGVAAYTRSVRFAGLGRGGKERQEPLEIRSLNNARGVRGRKGKAAEPGFKVAQVLRVE